ncbi:RNase A-like domain-containing protein [Yersinia enterocolitica]|nr:hypothetical protein [Yersinia enterocolitica]EKN5944394.1 hypothetical protein [Yersinia enterocolitica]ELW7379027.1 hypothetical protein [Yersinia enterocolitica]
MRKAKIAAKKKTIPAADPQKIRDFLAYFHTFTKIDLQEHESKTPPDIPGGHTIFKHVSISEQDLKKRLLDKPSLTMAGSFSDIDTAHAAITQAIANKFNTLQKWITTTGQTTTQVTHRLPYQIGIVIEQSNHKDVQIADTVTVVFLRDKTGEYLLQHSILTAYPTLEEHS